MKACRQAALNSSNLLLTPELSLWGYPPRDLLLNPLLFAEQNNLLHEISNQLAIEELAIEVLIGIAEPSQDNRIPKLFNSI